jgi:hypothetical protein
MDITITTAMLTEELRCSPIRITVGRSWIVSLNIYLSPKGCLCIVCIRALWSYRPSSCFFTYILNMLQHLSLFEPRRYQTLPKQADVGPSSLPTWTQCLRSEGLLQKCPYAESNGGDACSRLVIFRPDPWMNCSAGGS